MYSLDLIDIWQLKNPKKIRYTWRRRKQASRIDYFLVSFSLCSKISTTDISEHLLSDHSLITLQVTNDDFHRGLGFWKFNQSLLQSNLFVENTKTFISEFFKLNIGSANPHIVWDSFKCSLRGHCIKYR